MLLAIATGHGLSLAVGPEAGDPIAACSRPMMMGQAEALVPALAELLAPLGGPAFRPDGILLEVGPASFTGLRIGRAAADALALAWGCPLFGVRSTLMAAVEAVQAGLGPEIGIALAAPRGQVWMERFTHEGGLDSLRSLGPPTARLPDIARQDMALTAGRGWWGTGTGLADGRGKGPVASAALAIPAHLRQSPEALYVRPDDPATG